MTKAEKIAALRERISELGLREEEAYDDLSSVRDERYKLECHLLRLCPPTPPEPGTFAYLLDQSTRRAFQKVYEHSPTLEILGRMP